MKSCKSEKYDYGKRLCERGIIGKSRFKQIQGLCRKGNTKYKVMKQAHYIAQLEKLEHDSGVNMALLLTGAIGIAEGGEYAEIVKKCIPPR